MANEARMIELSNEAKNLLMEFYEEQKIICGGDNVLAYIAVSDDGRQITLRELDGEDEEYDLPCIEGTIGYILRGIGPCSSSFYEALDYAKQEYELEQEYERMTKEEFVQYAGSLFYLGIRAEEIYERLQEISKEAGEIWE